MIESLKGIFALKRLNFPALHSQQKSLLKSDPLEIISCTYILTKKVSRNYHVGKKDSSFATLLTI